MTNVPDDVLLRLWQSVQGPNAQLTGPMIRFAGLVLREARTCSVSTLEDEQGHRLSHPSSGRLLSETPIKRRGPRADG
jgi:hypothetical protein